MSRNSHRTRSTLPDEAFRFSRQDAARIRRVLAVPQPCVLCGSPQTVCSAIFVPRCPALWGGTPGKRRVLVYRLCARCVARSDKAMAVEARLMARLVGRNN